MRRGRVKTSSSLRASRDCVGACHTVTYSPWQPSPSSTSGSRPRRCSGSTPSPRRHARTRSFIANEALEAWINREIELIEDLQGRISRRSMPARASPMSARAPSRRRGRGGRQACAAPQPGWPPLRISRAAGDLVSACAGALRARRCRPSRPARTGRLAAGQRRYRARHRGPCRPRHRSARPCRRHL